MTKSRKKKRNRYQESRVKVLKTKIRRLWPVLVVFAGILAVVILGAGMSRLYHALLGAPWMKVEAIEISGLHRLDRTVVLNAMGVERGECILNVRLERLAERIRALPAVKDAAVRLDLPGRIVAQVTEREPVALLKCGDTFLVDREGVVLAGADSEGVRSLPLFTGLCGAQLKVGDSIGPQQISRINELVAAFNASGSWLPANSIVECRWNPGGFTLILGERGVPVDIGQENFSRKLARLRTVVATLQERQWTELVTHIDLDVPGKAYLDGNFPAPKAGKQAG